MGLKPFQMPNDADALLEIIPIAFQYPDHPEWNTSAAEQITIEKTMHSLKQTWWMIRLLGLVFRPLREMLLGYVWVEDGKPVGLCNLMRMGRYEPWLIGNVAVLPDYRRRGIAQQLVQATIELARKHEAKNLKLRVIDGNHPAFELYRQTGFQHYNDEVDYHFEGSAQWVDLPAPYHLVPLTPSTWRKRYELTKRLQPEQVQAVEPIIESTFHLSRLFYWSQKLADFLSKTRTRVYLIYEGDQMVIGTMGYQVNPTSQYPQHLKFLLDKEHAFLASILLQRLVAEALTVAPRAKLELNMHGWQTLDGMIDPTQIGFREHLRYRVMHYPLQTENSEWATKNRND